MKLKGTKKALAVACALACLCGAAGCKKDSGGGIASVLNKESSLAKGNSCGNIANLGGVAEYKGKVYYQNGDDNLKIYCSDKDGSNAVKVSDNAGYFINIVDDSLVYVNADDDYKIYKIKLDGSENTKLNDVQSYYVSVYGDNIYYSNWSDGNKIYSMKLDGTENKKISDDQAYYVTVDDGKVFYSNWGDNAKLYSIDTDGKNRLKLADTGAWYVVPDGDWVYYSRWETLGNQQKDATADVDKTDKFLCRVKKDGSKTEVLNEVPCGDVNVYDGRVFFTNWVENNIYSIALDGSDLKKVSDTYGVYLNTAAGKLYYVEYDDAKNASLKNISIEGEEK